MNNIPPTPDTSNGSRTRFQARWARLPHWAQRTVQILVLGLWALVVAGVLAGLLVAMAPTARAAGLGGQVDYGPELSDDESDACKALLCLSASGSQRPGECAPPISRFFSIKKKKPSDTIDARRDFLMQCPKAKEDPLLSRMAKQYATSAEYCDAKSLNVRLAMYEGTGGDYGQKFLGISDKMPSDCEAMYTLLAPDYYRTDIPVYVGVMGVDGQWVDQ